MTTSVNAARTKGKVLVVMSSADSLDLKDGKKYATGYYLNEFVVPYRKLVEAGYEPVIANPKGDLPSWARTRTTRCSSAETRPHAPTR